MELLIDLMNFFSVRDGKGFSSDGLTAAGGMGWDDFDDLLLIRCGWLGFDYILYDEKNIDVHLKNLWEVLGVYNF
jgi:hypothetical protein